MAKERVSDREFVNKAGEIVDQIEEAVGFQYTDKKSGESFKYGPLGDPGKPATMLALFGGITLAGNVRNTWNFEKGEKAATAIVAINERFALLTSGKWLVRGEGGRGPKWDRDALAVAVCDYMKAAGKPQDVSKVRAKLDEDKKYFSAVSRHPKVLDAYRKSTGAVAPVITDDALAA